MKIFVRWKSWKDFFFFFVIKWNRNNFSSEIISGWFYYSDLKLVGCFYIKYRLLKQFYKDFYSFPNGRSAFVGFLYCWLPIPYFAVSWVYYALSYSILLGILFYHRRDELSYISADNIVSLTTIKS